MKIKLTPILSFLCFYLSAQEPVKWNISMARVGESEVMIHFDATIEENWHLYTTQEFEDGPLPTELTFTTDSLSIERLGPLTMPTPKSSFDEIFQIELPYFDTQVRFSQRLKLRNTSLETINGELNYQACDDQLCIFRSEIFQVDLDKSVASAPKLELSEKDQIRSEQLTLALKNTDEFNDSISESKQNTLLNLFLLGFFGGLLALLTPCVFPMVPLTVSYFIKQGNSLRKGIWQAFLYGFFIILIYLLLSLPFHFIDALNPEILNTIATNVTLNIVFFGVFVFFAFSFFGYYELTLPAHWGSATDQQSGIRGMLGIFFMALTLAIVSFSCTGPILGSLLAGSLTAEGGAQQLTAGMAGFGVALALPFALFALFPNALKMLPKSGAWMNSIKVVLGFLELALALKFLSNADLVSHWGLLKREIFLGVWILLSLGVTLYLFGLYRFPHEAKAKRSKLRVGGAFLSLIVTIYLVHGLFSKDNGLTLLSGFPPPSFYSIYTQESECPLGLDCFKSYEEGKQVALSQNKPLLLDFTGWACVNCRRMEEKVWVKPAIYDLLNEKLVVVSLYVDDRTPLDEKDQFNFEYTDGRRRTIKTVGQQWATFQSVNFNAASQPFYVMLHPNGTLLNTPIQYTDANSYEQWIKKGLQTFDALPKSIQPVWLQN